jgi:hypothetical protein
MVLFLGGISLDLWRAFEAREDLASMADSAAAAGASRIDLLAYRETGVLRLDPAAAETAAGTHLDGLPGSAAITGQEIVADGPVLTITLQSDVEFSLLRIFLGAGRIPIQATGSAEAFASP